MTLLQFLRTIESSYIAYYLYGKSPSAENLHALFGESAYIYTYDANGKNKHVNRALLHGNSAPISERLKCLRYRHHFITCCRYSCPIYCWCYWSSNMGHSSRHYCIYSQRQHFKLKNVSIVYVFTYQIYICREMLLKWSEQLYKWKCMRVCEYIAILNEVYHLEMFGKVFVCV